VGISVKGETSGTGGPYGLTVILSCLVAGLVFAGTPSDVKFFDSNGIPIRYVTSGEGEAVVLIHGWMSDATMWGRDPAGKPKLSPLPGFKVIAIDCRGHGESGKPYLAKDYGAAMAEDVLRLLDHLRAKRAHLVGYSMGAFIVGKIAAESPDRVISAIYAAQAPLMKGSDNSSTEVDAFVRAVDAGKGMASYVIESTPASRPKPTQAQAEAYAKFIFAGKDLKALAAAGRSFPDLAVFPAALARAKIPTLFLYGDKEAESTQKRIAHWRTLMPAQEKVIPGADHVTTLTNPDFGPALVGFLKARKSG